MHSDIIFFIIINLFILFFFKKIEKLKLLIDKPDKTRKLHKKPTPLLGGSIIILAVIFVNMIYYFIESNNLIEKNFIFNNKLFLFFLSSYIIFIIGILDDKYSLNPNIKFILMTIVILILLIMDKDLTISRIKLSFFNGEINLGIFSLPFSILCYLLFINALNMFDGINLQSGIFCLIIFFWLLFLNTSNYISYFIIISLITFLTLNALGKVFLGDNGSLVLGFIISYLSVKNYNYEVIKYADDIFILMMIPGFDMLRLFIVRSLNKKNPFYPDRQHIHHILIKKNNLKKTTLIIFGLCLLPILLRFFNFNSLIIISISALAYLGILKKYKAT